LATRLYDLKLRENQREKEGKVNEGQFSTFAFPSHV
jgi:hypothetical protein